MPTICGQAIKMLCSRAAAAPEHGALELAQDRSARARGSSDRATPPPPRQTGRWRQPRQDLLEFRRPGRLQSERHVTRIRRHEDLRNRAGKHRPDEREKQPEAQSDQRRGRRRAEQDREQQRQRQPHAGIDDRHQQETKLRAISSAPGGIPIKSSPSPMTSSHSVTKLIDSVTRPARNFPNSSASR